MYIRVVILLRTFNPPNVAELKIDHVSLVFWYKHFDRRLMRVLFLRTVQPYQQFPDINSLLYRPKFAHDLTIPRSFIHCYANRATTYIDLRLNTHIHYSSFFHPLLSQPSHHIYRPKSKHAHLLFLVLSSFAESNESPAKPPKTWRVCSLFFVLSSSAGQTSHW